MQADAVPPDAAEEIDPDFALNLFTPEETTRLVSGKTAMLDPKGAVYYAPDFSLTTVWNGVHHEGQWSIDEEGGVCWHVVAWGEEPCRHYFLQDDILMSVYKGVPRRAVEFVDGDMTGAL